MSWENIVKRTNKINLINAYKEAIKKYYEENDLGEFDLERLHSESKDYAITYLRRHPNVNPRAVSSWFKHKSKNVLRQVILPAMQNEGLIERINSKRQTGLYKSWDSTLKSKATKARRLVEKTIKEMVEQYVEGKDKIFTEDLKQHIIDNLKAEHIKRHSVDGKVSNVISRQPTQYIQHKLETTFPTKIIPMAKSFGYGIVYGRPSRGKPTYLIKKSDSWESMTDSMIAEGKLFEAIYAAILQKFKFSAPSKEKVVAYLNANYERHPLFSNKWSTKNEGEGQ